MAFSAERYGKFGLLSPLSESSDLVEDREDLEVLLLADRIVLVVMALGARHRQAHPDLEGGVHAIDHGDVAELLVVGPPFGVGQRVAVEGGGENLIHARIGQHVAGNLLQGEAVEGHVAVDRLDDPIAELPDGSRLILGVAVGIGVASQVEPDLGPAFAISGLGKDLIDVFLISVRALVGDEAFGGFQRRRQAGQIERNPPSQRVTIRLARPA